MLEEVHEESCGHRLRGKALALKVLRVGYYWPSMTKDSIDYVKKCPKFQQHVHFHVTPIDERSTIMSHWPFNKWEIDLLGAFPLASGQGKYIIVAIDYFTK